MVLGCEDFDVHDPDDDDDDEDEDRQNKKGTPRME